MLRTTRSSCAAIFLTALAAAAVASAQAPEAPAEHASPHQLVEDLHGIFGAHGTRAVHAKGLILEGTFEPDPKASELSKAEHLQHEKSNVVVRFSNTTGLPEIPDNQSAASPRGMAVKFKLPSGTVTDIVAHSYNGFPVSNTDDFHTFLSAIPKSGPGAPQPTPLDQFLASHPAAKAFATTQKIPASFASVTYFGVNAFKLSNAAGASSFVRYQLVPEAKEAILTEAEAAKKSPNFLFDDLKARIAKKSVGFRLYAQIAEEGDKIDNPSLAWPDSRKKVLLGKISLRKLAANTPAEDQALAFDPNRVLDGVEAADAMLKFRSRTYPYSVRERRAAGAANHTSQAGRAPTSAETQR